MSLWVEIKKDLGAIRIDVSFFAQKGITGLLGSSGCGKSVTLKCIAGLVTPDRGHIELDGQVLFDSERKIDLPPQKRRVGYLFQNYALFPNLTVEQNIAAGVRERSRRREETNRLIASFCLEECRGKYPRQISGGQQQRTALARILASEPAALLLDEPFSALDSYLKWQVELELGERLKEFSGPVLFVTHDREEVYRQCRQVCVLDRGRSQPMQTVAELFNEPKTISACRLSGCQNLSQIQLEAGRVKALDWGVTLDLPEPLPQTCEGVGIWAHHIRPADGPGPNRLHVWVAQKVNGRLATTLILAPMQASGGCGLLRMEWKNDCIPPEGVPEQLWVELPPEELLFLSDE